MMDPIPSLLASCEVARSGRSRTFVGGSRLRLRVVAGDRFLAPLPPILRHLNYTDSGFAAVAKPAGEPAEVRDVVLIDGSLPEALDICRALPAHIAKILASANRGFADRKSCADAGIDALIADPVDPRELADWLEHFDGRSETARAAVLVVDDDELAAECVAMLLAERGIDTEIVTDPTRVFETLGRHSFDLVLMDLDMPQVNGVDLARMIRQDRRHLSVPIVFLSAGGDTETQMLARRFGGDDFISKRMDRGLLARLVELRVERARVLRALIERDGLTGLVDHLRFLDRLGQEFARSRRTGTDCTLVMIDIDRFKAINDTWGHQTGDMVLRRLAKALVSWLRGTDVVGRYGGEEFGVLMLDTTPERAAPVIDGFRRHFSTLEMAEPDGTFRVTFSAGVAGGRQAGDAAELVAAADEALYRAKSEGRDRVVVAGPRFAAPAPVGSPRPPTAGGLARAGRSGGRGEPAGRSGRHAAAAEGGD